MLYIILIVIFWIYYFRYYDADTIHINKVYNECKTGDLLLFHALNNNNCYLIGHFTHIGVVFELNAEKYILHAYNPSYEERTINKKCGVEFVPLYEYLMKYKGHTYYKKYHIYKSQRSIQEIKEYIAWVCNNMYYTLSVPKNAIHHFFLNSQLSLDTNCGELAYITLMFLGILDISHFSKNRKHHLHWLCNLSKTEYGYYDIPLKILR